jgi:negative regulator of sigma-B (phosphoserine phosphatase)
MTELVPEKRPILAWGMAGASLTPGEVSGDLQVVAPFSGGVLVAVIDGLGHGAEAAEAAEAAGVVLEEGAGEPLDVLVQRCHERIRRTRGVVMSLASFDSRTSSMAWIGVGNVAAILLRSGFAGQAGREAVQNRGGVVGYRLPALSISQLAVAGGDLLIMATDGIESGFSEGIDRQESDLGVAAALILAAFSRGSDDALVVAARYLEPRA